MSPVGLDLAARATPVVMGVLNVTPDSFSDGGHYLRAAAAIEHGRALAEAGAELVDVGGESTRPGAQRPTAEQETDRVLPVIEALVAAGIAVSIDTMRATVARAAVGAGAVLVNDVSGGLADPAMAETVAALEVPFVAMHWRGHSADMQSRAEYDDVLAQVCDELATRRDALVAAGIGPERIVLDPGLGFAKTAEHNWALLAGLPALLALGHPLLIGASRKRFLATVGVAAGGEPLAADARDPASAAIAAILATSGIWGLRVHDVAATVTAIEVARRIAGSDS